MITVAAAQVTGASNKLLGWISDRTSGPAVEVLSVSYANKDSGSYVFEKPVRLTKEDLAQLSELPWGDPEYHEWARNRGGIDPGTDGHQGRPGRQPCEQRPDHRSAAHRPEVLRSPLRGVHRGPVAGAPFKHYQRLYVGASNTVDGRYAEKDPNTWTGPGMGR